MQPGLLVIEEDHLSEHVEYVITNDTGGQIRGAEQFLHQCREATAAGKRVSLLPHVGRVRSVRLRLIAGNVALFDNDVA
jgi:hypothetical protein